MKVWSLCPRTLAPRRSCEDSNCSNPCCIHGAAGRGDWVTYCEWLSTLGCPHPTTCAHPSRPTELARTAYGEHAHAQTYQAHTRKQRSAWMPMIEFLCCSDKKGCRPWLGPACACATCAHRHTRTHITPTVNMQCSPLATHVMHHGLYRPHCPSHCTYKQHCCPNPHNTWLHSLTERVMQLHTHGVITTAVF